MLSKTQQDLHKQFAQDSVLDHATERSPEQYVLGMFCNLYIFSISLSGFLKNVSYLVWQLGFRGLGFKLHHRACLYFDKV